MKAIKQYTDYCMAWIHWALQRGTKGLDVVRHPALIPFYVTANYLGTTSYIVLGSQTPLWFSFFFSCIMFIYVIFCLYLYKCFKDSATRSFVAWAFFNGVIIWAYYVMCFMHEKAWAVKHSLEVPAFGAIAGIALYAHYIFIGKKQDLDDQQTAGEELLNNQ